jgi:MYXO-CTERM domain-containing protein
LTSNGSGENYVYRSDDGGASWTAIGSPLPDRFLPEAIRIAPSRPERIYVSGGFVAAEGGARRGAILRSDDGGESFELLEVELIPEEDATVHVLAVGEDDPDLLYVRIRGVGRDRLLRSDDGATTLEEFARIDSPEITTTVSPFGFAVAGDGALWFGTSTGGLVRFTEDAGAQMIDPDLAVGCIVAKDDELYVCGDGFGDGFAVARLVSADPFELEPFMTYDEVTGLVPCLAEETTCAMAWTDFLIDTGRPVPDADAGDAATDGGEDGAVDAGPSPREPGGGCDCSAAGGPADAILALGLVPWLLSRRRRRRDPAIFPR